MNDNSLLEEIIASDKQERSRRIRNYLFGLIVLVVSIVGITATSAQYNEDPALQASTTKEKPTESYSYNFMEAKCSAGLEKYRTVVEQIKEETTKVSALTADPTWASSSANINAAISVLESHKEAATESFTRQQRLEDCLKIVASKKDFTDEQVANIDGILNDVPTFAQSDSATVSSTSLPVFTYRPNSGSSMSQNNDYEYNHSPNYLDSSNSSNSSPTLPTPTKPAPRECNEQLKASFTMKYDSDSDAMAYRHSKEYDELAASLGSSGLSGIGGQRLYFLRQQQVREIEQLEYSYSQQLKSIYC